MPLRNAVRALRSGDRDAALRLLRQSQVDRPDLAPAEILLANLYVTEGQPDQARQVLEESAVLYPEDPEPHLMFADLAWRQRHITDACVQYQRALELAADFNGSPARQAKLKVWALAGLGSVAEARGQLETAGELYRELLKLDPRHPQARFRMGHVLFGLGQVDEAVEQFRAAREFHDSAPMAELTVAGLYQQAGDLTQVEPWIQRAVDAAPKDVVPLIAMARFQLDVRHDAEEAGAFVERAVQVAPKAREPQLLRGEVAWRLGKLAEAEKILEKMVLQAPDDLAANIALTGVLAEQDDPNRRRRAEELALLTAADNPQSADAAATLGWVEFQLGKFAQAEQQLRAAVQMPGASRDAKYYLARVLYRRGQIAAAQQMLREVLAANGPFVHLREARAWRLEVDGSPAKP
ncbi:MAG: tetratricopeptide repeat protein [Planctomycetales bacterium]|nr:tetratricopeptide repeat protein [Planctomycetales bacterium]